MLEFVSLSADADGKDLQTRRKVRSQAMRDFRRRQREEREASKTSRSSSSKSAELRFEVKKEHFSTSAPTSSPGSSQGESAQRGDAVRNSQPFDVPYAPSESTTVPNQSLTQPDRCLNLIPHVGAEPRATQRPYQSSTGSAGKERARSPFKHASSTPRSSPAGDVRLMDPFQTPAQMAQMLNFLHSYIFWLLPGVSSTRSQDALSQVWGTVNSPMLVAACCLASPKAESVRADGFSEGPTGNYEVYKARVLRDVRERMQSSEKAVSDEVLGSLGCLLSFELSRGSFEASMHLSGIKSISRMSRGKKGFKTTAMWMMLESLDLIHTAMFNVEPVLTTMQYHASDDSTPMIRSAATDMPFHTIDVLLLAEQQNWRQLNPPYSEYLVALPELIHAAGGAMDNTTTSTVDEGYHFHNIQKFRESLDRFNESSSRKYLEAADAYYLARSCYLTYLMCYNVTVNGTPLRHVDNHDHVEHLHSALRSISENTWDPFPYIRVVILLTGILASSNSSATSFFKAHLVRCIYQQGSRAWRRIRMLIVLFMRRQKQLVKW